MGSPEAIQPPITAPVRPNRSDATAPSAPFRAAAAAVALSFDAVPASIQAGVPAKPLYHVPKNAAAPRDARTRSIGTATSQRMAHAASPARNAVGPRS